MKLGTITELKKRLLYRWKLGRYLSAEILGENIFPIEENLSGPTAKEITENFDQIRKWTARIRLDAEKARLNLQWKKINHRVFGHNTLPRAVAIDYIDQLAEFIGEKTDLQQFRSSAETLLTAFPELQEWTARKPFDLPRNSEELKRLISVTQWILAHPRPGIYLRQLPVPGVDTKFVETRKKILTSWLNILLPPEFVDDRFSGAKGFFMRYGFATQPDLVRIRSLDKNFKPGGFSDITITAPEFCSWNPDLKRIFVVENNITALAFPEIDDSLLIFGSGYGFASLSDALWLHARELYYWGDIDTHGFAILNQFRSTFPKAKSFLMDRQTLLQNRSHWGVEDKPTCTDLVNLTTEESDLYDDLRFNRIEKSLRLEQELIQFSYLLDFLKELETPI